MKKSASLGYKKDMKANITSGTKSDNRPILSVIIPVYNVEKYITRCLESVVNQTYRSLEIICVNDCSAENEEEIIKEYCGRDKRIKYVKHDSNRGLFQARITGLKIATGRYFAFLDSDDHISMDYYRLMLNKIMGGNADIVIGDFVDEYEDGRLEYYNYDNLRSVDIDLQGDDVYDTFMAQRGFWFGWHTVWNKIYSMELWGKSRSFLEKFAEEYGHLVMTEDILFSCIFWRFAGKVVNSHNAFYYYYHHSGQSVANGSYEKYEKNISDVAAVFRYFKKFLTKENLYERYAEDYSAFLDLYIEFWTGNADALQSLEEREMGYSKVKGLFGKTVPFNEKDHFHYTMRTELNSFGWYEEINRSICSPDIKVVSFDIFDTLLLRPFYKPSDLFCLMNEAFNKMVKGLSFVDFHKIRMEAEKELRLNSSKGEEEVKLHDIYVRIGEIFLLDRAQVRELEELEKQLEIKYVVSRKCGQELFELAKEMGKRVICTSDIYLPADTVQSMLKKCGFEPDKIYLSSDYLQSKATGNLFTIVLKEEECNPEELVHIGDNWESDIVEAEKKGIRKHHLVAPMTQFKEENGGIFTGSSYSRIFAPSGKQYMGENALHYMGIRCMLAVVANKMFDNPYVMPFHHSSDFNANPYFVGYYALGMHLHAVTNWIVEEAEKRKKDKVIFVSRDGYLPMKAFEVIKDCEGTQMESSYLHISRKATALLQSSSVSDVESYMNSFNSNNVAIRIPVDTFSRVAKDGICNDVQQMGKQGIAYYGSISNFKEVTQLGHCIYMNYIDSAKAGNYIEAVKIKMNEFFGGGVR